MTCSRSAIINLESASRTCREKVYPPLCSRLMFRPRYVDMPTNRRARRRCAAKSIGFYAKTLQRGKVVTFLYAILDGDERSFQYCNAGHLYPTLVSRVSVGTLEQGGAVLGVFPAWTYEDSVIDL